MQLEVGKYYRNRFGEIIKIKCNQGGVFCFFDENSKSYTDSGRYSLLGGKNNCDLIEEVPMIEALLEENGIDLSEPLQILPRRQKWVDCEVSKVFQTQLGVYYTEDFVPNHFWITEHNIKVLRNTPPPVTVDFSKSSSDQWHRILWQKLFDLYRENGGNLDCMNDLLIDLKSCDQLCKRVLEGATPTFFFSFSSGSDMTFWSSDNSHGDCDFTFKVVVSKDGATFEEV